MVYNLAEKRLSSNRLLSLSLPQATLVEDFSIVNKFE